MLARSIAPQRLLSLEGDQINQTLSQRKRNSSASLQRSAPSVRLERKFKRSRVKTTALHQQTETLLPLELTAKDLLLPQLRDLKMFTEGDKWALTLSTFAGLSTTIGGLLAIIKRPTDALLAFLLGTAIGVMFVLSVVEMWLHNASEHGWPNVTLAVFCGAMLYKVAQPFLPDFVYEDFANQDKSNSSVKEPQEAVALVERSTSGQPTDRKNGSHAAKSATKQQQQEDDDSKEALARSAKATKARSAELLRLGLLMAFTMTLHNLPEGFAVAFASFTDFGPIMAAAIALHNIPEGIIVAAPVYAATGSRWKALGVATASGLSEPVGALIALLAAKPMLSEEGLHHILAFVGGIMAAVCLLELWPEGKKCRSDDRLAYGIALGGVLMGWTLWVGV